MSINPWLLYLILKLDSIVDFFITVGVISTVLFTLLVTVGVTIWIASESDGQPDLVAVSKRLCKNFSKGLVLSLCWLFITMLIPTTKELAAILIIPKIVNNEILQKDASELYTLGVNCLKEKLANNPHN